ncbi:hypothetical protein KUV81_02715 [Ferrimonas balearica]|nr:hypothetical protein [Ferrimonas balearica]MBY5991029.1 hypothetical protein [Ferrimonas balearica]
MSESSAILLTLAERYPDASLIPRAPEARAMTLQGLIYLVSNCYSAIGVVDYPERFTTATDPAERDRVKAGATARLHHCWRVAAERFDPALFWVGEKPSAFGLLASVVSRWSGGREALASHAPHWLAALVALDAQEPARRVFVRHWPEAD